MRKWIPSRLPTGSAPPQQKASRCSPRRPTPSALGSGRLHLAQAGPALVKHRHSPSAAGNVGGGHVNRMRQPLSVHCDVALNPGHLFARVIALVPGAAGILDALGVHDAEAGLLAPAIAPPGRANRFFKTCSRMDSSSGLGRSLHCRKYL